MEITKDRILRVRFILLCLAALLTLQCVRAENIADTDASKISVPPTMGLSNVFIDMGKPNFLKARPNAQQFHLFSQGRSGENRIYSEELTGHQFFQTGMYFLSAGKINHIRLFGRHDFSQRSNLNHNFLTEAFRIYGKPSAIAALDSIASPTAQAAVIWNQDPYWILALVSSDPAITEPKFTTIELKIAKVSSVSQMMPASKPILKIDEERILSPIRQALRETFDGMPVEEKSLAKDPAIKPNRKTEPMVIQGGRTEEQQAEHKDIFKKHISYKWPSWNRKYSSILYLDFRAENFRNKAAGNGSAIITESRSTPFFANGLALLNVINRPSDLVVGADRIAFVVNDSVYILDQKAGALGLCNDPERVRRRQPSWSSGKNPLLAMSGTHSPGDQATSDDDDIFIAKIRPRLNRASMEKNWCIAHLPGRDILPIFTSDDQWVVFAHEEKSEEKAWAIYRVRPDKSFHDKEYSAPEKIIEGLPEPERLSPFPDGGRILISYTGNDYEMIHPPEIIDIEAKTRAPLTLPVLFDPDFPQGKPLVPHEIAVSPDGKQIAFSALRWSGDPKDDGAILIYTCDLDGKNLKRITPPDDMPIEIYKYPQKGVTALNAWEKLQPKPNLGRPVNPFDIETHQKQMEEWDKMEKQAKEKADTNS